MENRGEGNTILEEQIARMLTELYKNPELVNFMMHLQNATNGFEIERYIPRVKSISSAQRTARVKNFKSLEDANDYIGVAFVVRDEHQIYDIAKRLCEVYPKSGSIDFLAEENVYSPLCYIKKVPPLTYNIITRENVGNQKDVPVEIRICTKESFLSNQAVHDTVYKNDNLDISLDERIKLLCLSQHVVYKLALLGMRENLTDEEIRKHQDELKTILENNKGFLAKHAQVFESVILDYGVSAYEYDHYTELERLDLSKRKTRLNNVRKKYAQMYAQMGVSEADFVERANKPIQDMKNMNLDLFSEGIGLDD